MTVKDVLGECLIRLGNEDYTKKSTYTVFEQVQLNKLLAALNVVYRGAVQEALPSFAEEEIVLADGAVDVSALAHNIVYPVWLKRDGVKQNIIRNDGLKSNFSGKAVLKYSYMPEKLTISGDVPDCRLSASLLASGTVAEFYFEEKLFDLAKNFDTEFRGTLSWTKYKGKEMRFFTVGG